MDEQFPAGWKRVRLDDVAVKIVGGGTPSKANSNYYSGSIPFMTVKDMKCIRPRDTIDHITDEALKNSSANLVLKDTIIIASRMGLGKVVRADFDTAINQDLKAIFLHKGISKDFFEYWYRSQENVIESLGKGTTVKGIRLEVLKNLAFPLPPLPEQKRIADKLDSLLAKVDACKVRLDKVPEIIKRFRQSVLADATSGRLTENLRSEKDYPVWGQKSISDVGKVIGGLTKNSKRNAYNIQMPYLRVANVYENKLVLDEIKQIGIQEREIARVSLEKNDLLIVEGNGSKDQIGRVAKWNGEIEDCLHQNHLIKFRADLTEVDPSFALFWLISPEGKKHITDKATSAAGLYTLSISKISSLPIPLPSIPEQKEIVKRVEALFSIADKMEEKLKRAQERVDKMTASILGKAFKGELIPQDPNDEPASKLLYRIQSELEVQPITKRKK